MPFMLTDYETTGLMENVDEIVEVGFMLMDDNMMPIGGAPVKPFRHLIMPKRGTLAKIAANDDVSRMHGESGLTRDLELALDGRIFAHTLEQSENELIAMVDEAERHITVTERYGWTLFGSGVHFDDKFMKVNMPRLYARLGYRRLDVSNIRTFFGFLKGLNVYEQGVTHRADDDILDHYNEFSAYLVATAKAFGISVDIMQLTESVEEMHLASSIR